MLTAKEYFLSKLNKNATGGLYEIEFDVAEELAIEFAKLHVEAALKAAHRAHQLPKEDEEFTLDAYPLNNIQ